MKNTVLTFQKAKENGEKLAMLTAYDYSMAKIIDESGVNGILIGDSLGNVIKGDDDTLGVTVDDIIYHTKAVKKGAKNALIVSDMPFLSYHVSVEQAVMNAGRIIKEGGANAVKLEGGADFAPQIKAIVNAQIPVMGHLGLTPQSINAFGGFKVQGKSEEAAKKLIADAKALEEAGVFAITLEGIPAKVAELITKTVSVPTIGIGAGKDCDGQILVYQDMLGMFDDYVPKFVKQYANIGSVMREAISSYVKEVKEVSFPEEKHTYKIDENELKRLY
ncbi:3-methyl-2-oxobutanoate hydroxymethyltransferase [uncultured Clostridium sp.]|uniref:3-methyl-2-oxobutanoate hydroxymethyltransferase n=1 Tax=uncultured Clostridium sp. TaxID=59620 RepID=UPI0025FB1409|nr:3-methyl-2-oxobutanoate hydroxymethyltransferase [uncultured Clostridium sp.]